MRRIAGGATRALPPTMPNCQQSKDGGGLKFHTSRQSKAFYNLSIISMGQRGWSYWPTPLLINISGCKLLSAVRRNANAIAQNEIQYSPHFI